MNRLEKFAFHPLLIAAYPVVALLAYNIDQVRPADALRSLGAALLFALAVWLAGRVLLRKRERAALVASLLVALFFSYGHVYNFLEQTPLWGLHLGRHRLLMPLWLALAGLGVWWAARPRRNLATLTRGLNLVSAVTLALPLLQLGSYGLRVATTGAAPASLPPAMEGLRRPEQAPDVYFIILDGYGRQDILQQEYGLDNTAFLAGLAEMGFTLPGCNRSNYAQTELSLTSALNLNYLGDLGLKLSPDSTDRAPLRPYLHHSLARRALESLGYTFVAFDSGFFRTQLEDADVYLSPANTGFGGLNGFESMLIRTSAGLALTEASAALPRWFASDVDAYTKAQLRQRINYIFDELAELPQNISGPKFVFAHVMGPHEPYVFGAQGEEVSYPNKTTPQQGIEGYRNEVTYLNRRTLEALHALLEKSSLPPVIVLMGDHGPSWTTTVGRMSNLMALYLPGEAGGRVAPTVTPINAWRGIFDAYFGTHLGTVADASYFSSYDAPYRFQTIAPEEGCGP